MKNLIFLSFLMAISIKTYAQKDSLLLYPEGVPGAKATKITEKITRGDGISRVSDVTQPVLYIYQTKENPTGSSVIICPGGGYGILAIDHEGYDIAKWFNERGISAFVLKYRLPKDTLMENKEIRPLQDAQQAIRIVRKNAAKYKIDASKLGIMGFSAGGHLAATVATHFDKQVGEITDPSISVRPDFALLIYPVISFSDKFGHIGSRDNLIGKNPSTTKIDEYSNEKHVTPETPPTFLISTSDDFVNVENSLHFLSALKANKVPAELHVYEKGGHGYGITKKNRGPVEGWADRMADWLKARGLMK
jgi:acetyl esterase/lipase